MAKTVVGLFDTFTDAQNVVQELVNAGFQRNDISLLANDARGEYANMRSVGDTESGAGEGAAAGAVGGGVLGGVLGLLVGVGALAIPGIGPVLAAGPLAAALGTAGASTLVGAGIGAAAGGVIGALVGAGIPEEDASFYAEGVRRGGTLVLVKSSDDMANRAYDILQRYGAVDVDKRSGEYRTSGWNSFDPNSGPYSSDTEGKWDRSSKLGTTGGAVAGAATGAAIGSVGGPIGTAIGGVAGAVTGAGVGAAGDIAGESVEEGDTGMRSGYDTTTGRNYDTTTTNRDYDTTTTNRDYGMSGDRETPGRGDNVEDQWRESSKVGTAGGTAAGAATGAAIGSVGGPVGTVIGGLAGAAAGAGVGAAGDVAGESAEDYFQRYDNDFHTHYDSYGASSGYTYDQYQPVYRYGYGLANDPTYRDYNWDRLEPEARMRWEERNPGTWDRFKDSVRYAWERAKNTVS